VFLLLVLAFLETVLAGADLATTFTVFEATALVALGAILATALTVLAVALTVFFDFVLIFFVFYDYIIYTHIPLKSFV
jgi:hypothetical protein